MLKIDIGAGEEVMNELSNRLAQEGVKDAAIVSVIGAVDRCCVSTMPKHDASQDTLREYEQPLEMFGLGEVKDGTPHIHCTLGTESGSALAGHLHWAHVTHWFVSVYVQPFSP